MITGESFVQSKMPKFLHWTTGRQQQMSFSPPKSLSSHQPLNLHSLLTASPKYPPPARPLATGRSKVNRRRGEPFLEFLLDFRRTTTQQAELGALSLAFAQKRFSGGGKTPQQWWGNIQENCKESSWPCMPQARKKYKCSCKEAGKDGSYGADELFTSPI